MANSLSAIIPRLLAQGLLALRQQAVMPRLVNRQYEIIAGAKGSSIDVPFSSPIAAQDVAPANTPPSTADTTPTYVSIPLNQWKEAPFYMTDKDVLEAQSGIMPMQASEAIKVLANTVDSYILGLYKSIYGFYGTPGSTPFAQAPANLDFSDAIKLRTILNQQLCPVQDRRVVLDPLAEGNAMNQRALQDQSWRGNGSVIQQGQIGSALGMDWYMDQNVPTHVSTPLTAGAATVNGVHTVNQGSTDNGRTGTVSIAKATNTSPLVAGDVLTFAGDTQTYVVVTGITLAVGNTTVTISPALKTAKAGGEAVSLKASHTVNLFFHPQAFAFVSRPLDDTQARELGSLIQSAVDPVSGLTLRLEVTREHKRNRWSYDILYGGQCIRPELGARLAG